MSEVSSATLRRACKVIHVDAVYIEYFPCDLNIEVPEGANILSTCRELGVAVVAYSPLGKRLPTNTFASTKSTSGEGDMRSTFPRFYEENVAEIVKIVAQFMSLAERKGCTAAQRSIAWLLKQGLDNHSYSWYEEDQVPGGESLCPQSRVKRCRRDRNKKVL